MTSEHAFTLRRMSSHPARSVVGVLLTVLLLSNAGADEPWVQAQLTEQHMRALTRTQCIAKTVATLQQEKCRNDECRKTMAGVLGDCLTWSRGDPGPLCTHLPTHYEVKCRSGALEERSCRGLRLITEGYCTGRFPDPNGHQPARPKQQ